MYEAWLPFWNKFLTETDKAKLVSVTKFAHLKELVDPKVRVEIDGLPFTTEGYVRAKNIPIGEYGKTSEIMNASRTLQISLSLQEHNLRLSTHFTRSSSTMCNLWRHRANWKTWREMQRVNSTNRRAYKQI